MKVCQLARESNENIPQPMGRCLLRLSAVAIGCLFAMSSAGVAQTHADQAISFNRDIRPLLSDKCFQCHGPDEESREADLRFDLKEQAFADLGGYHAIVPGDAEASEMIVRIVEPDPDMRMPPADSGKQLQPEEIQLLKRWINEGANWTEFWAYQPPRKHPVPEVPGLPASANWIDKMVQSRLAELSLPSSPRADKVTLIRRLYFDLIGLPPRPQDVARFVNDGSQADFERVVDQLLTSSHFGERLAVYWLDLVRFADTVGYHGDQDQNISPYRDWVINAFNANMPFDQFTREQLAGDLLPDRTQQQLVATGYNRLLQTSHEGGLQPQEYRAIYAADRVRNVSNVWMGATVGCAQCHDHKYDPYTSKDFYSLAAFFADIDDEKHFKVGTNSLPTARPPEILLISDENRQELETVNRELESVRDRLQAAKKQLQDVSKNSPSDADEIEREIKQLKADEQELDQRRQVIEESGAWTMVTEALDNPRPVRILPRGNWLDDSGEIVQPAIPEFLGALDLDGRRATRLDLANWLTDPERGSGLLTARVFVNRVWYLLLGVGISNSLDDFGGQGEPPSNPELLDNLAVEFVESGWDIKRLIRTILTSQTYQQASLETPELREKDPSNRWFARQSRYRLPAEFVRDDLLAVSGLLNLESIGGKSIKPDQPGGYYRHLNFPPRVYHHDEDDKQYRRGVYVHWQRQFLHPTFKSLDAPMRLECTARRPRSNTPLASLSLLNDPGFVEAARVFPTRFLANNDSFERRLNDAFMLAVSRKPTSSETEVLRQLYQTSHEYFQQNPAEAQQLISTGDRPVAIEFETVELAAWTTVCRAILNLSETITRN
jgi:hypothetical protein